MNEGMNVHPPSIKWLLIFTHLEVEVLEGSLESAERVLREGQVAVVGQFERSELESTEGIVGYVTDPVARQVQER